MRPPAGHRRHTRVAVCFAVLATLTLACERTDQQASSSDTPPSAATPTSTPDNPNDEGARPKVVCLGDSLTAGLGLVESQSYPSVLQRKIDAEQYGFEVVNAGVSGDTSAGGLRRLDWALQGDVKVLVVALGGNDALRGLSVTDMRENLSTIVERARARGVVVILAGMQAPPNFGEEYTAAFRQAFAEVARQHRARFIPFLLDKVAGQPALNQPDGIHPNARGAEIVAETVWGALSPVLQQMSSQ
jgi:acyl-CoA thioesterase-1